MIHLQFDEPDDDVSSNVDLPLLSDICPLICQVYASKNLQELTSNAWPYLGQSPQTPYILCIHHHILLNIQLANANGMVLLQIFSPILTVLLYLTFFFIYFFYIFYFLTKVIQRFYIRSELENSH